ncbi:MAG: T9SS type A sorting domain-containing protein [Bacteroidales bacterium]|nr:T9SS type A sorting domain-containing protein [Bacteroidales bacterium]
MKIMKNPSITSLLIGILLFVLSFQAFSQTCIDPDETKTAWTNIPYFNGLDTYISVNELNANSHNNASYWFTGSFSIDFWVRCTWPAENAPDNEYFVFGAGVWCDDFNSLFIYFQETTNGNWRIRLGDGNNSGSNTDILYNIDYANDYMDKWVHLTLTYDDTNLRLYEYGEKVKEGEFIFNKIASEYCVIGGHQSNHGEDFRGYISGFRIWENKKLTDNQVYYIVDKTFNGEETFGSYSYLNNYLTINMFTDVDNIYSLVPDKSMVEYGITRSVIRNHPARPISAYNHTVTIDWDNIRFDWETNSASQSYFIYRKGGTVTDWDLLCVTNSTYYIDDDPSLEGGVEYDYRIRTYWKNEDVGRLIDAGNDIIFDNINLKAYNNVTGLVITEASSVCNGLIELSWNQVTQPSIPDTYAIYCKIGNNPWTILESNVSALQYTHNVSVSDLGTPIQYKIDAEGDNYLNYSSIKTGSANTECTTAPTNVVATVNGSVFDITWDFIQVGAPATAFRIYRKIGTGNFEIHEEGIDINLREYTDYAESCVDYEYKVEAYNQCGENGSMSSSSNAVYKPMVFDDVFSYTDPVTGAKSEFDASKGYYSTKVLLEWSVNPNKIADVEGYEIYRRKTNQPYSLLTTITNANATYYDDNSTEANVFYEYLIRAKGECNSIIEYSDSLEVTGFRYSSGIVSGKITYAGGNAVENVEVRISTEENLGSSSLYFDGIDDLCASLEMSDDSILHNPFSFEAWIKPKLMMSGQRNLICSFGLGHFYIGLQNMRPIAAMNEYGFMCAEGENPIVQLEGDTVLLANTWYHIATTIDPYEGLFKMYLNGVEIASTHYQNPQIPWIPEDIYAGEYCSPKYDEVYVIYGGGPEDGSLYKGNLDEVRIWTKLRTPEEIKRDYIRILTGGEEGLAGYYRFDENYGQEVYDLSHVNHEFNKNDIVFGEPESLFPQWSNETPSFEQLHPSGISNENGNYIITGIRYSGTGNVFSANPILGIHEFDPSDLTLFIGDGSPVHNNINFIDQSAFTFTGTVYYSGTNCPVDAANIYIDNTQQFDAGGNPIQTNEYGQISVSVPIGQHFISVKKDGHTFEHNGQWPHPTQADPYKTFNFQEDVNNITFYDETTVVVCGRFVGGDVEGNKKLGFDKSIANIGQGSIVFKNETGYDIDPDPNNATSSITILTDNQSGEYEISLIPCIYKIDSVWNDNYHISNLDLGTINLTEIPEITTDSDTTYNYEIIGTDTIIDIDIQDYQYHYLRNFIYYTEPTIHLFGVNGNPLIGESEYYYTNPETEITDTIDLINNSPFNYPVFIMGSSYDIDIRVLSVYTNFDLAEIVYDTVPVQNAQVSLINNLDITEQTQNLETDETGRVIDYDYFKVGLPNMSMNTGDLSSFTKTMTITAQAGNFNIAWNGGDVYRAYVLGGVDAGGVNYVTYGPEIPTFILRDPPGDRSYTILEQGSSFSSSRDYSYNLGGSSVYDNVLMRGVKFELGGGLAGPVFTSEVQSDLNAGISTTQWVDKSGEYMEKYTFHQTFSTSSEPNAVGSMADVYIGKSTNLFFTETENLRIYPKTYCSESGLDYLEDTELSDPTADYSIGKRPGFAVTDDPSSTFFIYSQNHILNNLLPTYRDLIYVLLASPKYESKITSDHLYYGFSNDNPVWADTIAMSGDTQPSYEFLGEQQEVDSIAFLNQQISIWLQTIALNEAAKLQSDMDVVENISFDGNAGEYTNSVEMTTESFSHTDYFYRFEVFGGTETGFSINKTGLITYSQTYKNVDQSIGQTDIETQSLKWTYVIDDSNQGDYYSFNVMTSSQGILSEGKESFLNSNNFDEPGYNMGNLGSGTAGAIGSLLTGVALSKLVNPLAGQVFSMLNTVKTAGAYMGAMAHYSKDVNSSDVYFGLQGASPMFKIMGGQSRCPYEGEEYTVFYIDSVTHEPLLLHLGTQGHEAPKIEIVPATVINVPEGSAAVFELQLMNESPTGKDLTYELLVDEAANPDGAVMRIDGVNPNRPFFVPAGETITKTLTVERGSSGVMEFDDLQLILHSTCQYNPDDNFPDIADTVAFSAHFVPTCTEVNFMNIANNWTVNVYNSNIMPITIGNYNINLATFEKVYFQYQQPGATPTTAMVLYNDTINTDWDEYTGEKIYIDNQSQVSFNWNTTALNDGNYTLILTTLCSDGSIFETDHLEGIIDRITPRPFGTPEPADGILSYGEDISVLFNEEINSGELYNFGQYGSASYISVRGMLNGTDLIDSPSLLHDASVHFDGEDDYMKIDHINLDHTDFTIEFWAKRNGNGRENIINLGNTSNGGLWIGFNETDNFVVEMDGQIMVSENSYPNLNEWAFYSVGYNRGNESTNPQLTLFILSGVSGTPEIQEFDMYSSLEGTMYVGYCPADGSAFYGNIHELRIWNYMRLSTDISAQKGQILNGYEQGLYGLWPMNESAGLIAKDIAFGRNAELNATWHVSRNGKGLNLEGDNCLPIPAGEMVFSNQSDFTIEFWFKTGNDDNITLLSNGDFENDLNVNGWQINAGVDSQIRIVNNGNEIVVDATDHLDNNWHHFAMSLNRIGYLNVYLDAKLVKTSPVSNFKGFGASKLVAGARWYSFSMIDYFDQYMTGAIDEIRVWNSARTKEQIQRYMNHTLKGDEPGLKAYFPFEDVTIEDPSISNENSGNFTLDSIGIAGDTLLAIDYFTSETPNMKLQRPEILIPHTIVVSDDEVIITPNIDDNQIENQILDISIKKVKDLNNNELESTITWSAFIDKNNVVWDIQELNVEKFIEEETSITVNIRNKGGLNESYNITNIPVWMDVTPSSGILLPLEVEQIEIKINPELNIGSYQHDLNLVASMEYNERLALNIKVNGHAPDWSVDPENYTLTANVIGQLSISNIISTDEDDIVACFVGNECRGVANVEYLNNLNVYLCFMNIYANTNGEIMSFKVYDASTGDIYSNVSPHIEFLENTIYGSLNDPLPINATNYVEQNIDLTESWNWISLYVYGSEFNNLNLALNNPSADKGDLIKSQSSFASMESNHNWLGSLNSLNVESSYKIKVSETQVFSVSGYRVIADTIEIPIVKGWNWIGYPLSVQKTVMEAMSSLTPANNDILKSQHRFAIYNEVQGWIGSLTYMQPGEGYVLYSSNNGTLEYSSGIAAKNSIEFEDDSHLPNTEQNMTIISEVDLETPELYEIIAYDENGLCGNAKPMTLQDGRVVFFITINSKAPEIVSFQAKSIYGNQKANEIIGFQANSMIGSINAPLLLTFENDNTDFDANVYPNPFSSKISLNFHLNNSQKVQLKLYNGLGTEVSAVSVHLPKGKQEIDLLEVLKLGKDISKGVYMLKLEYNQKEKLIKIVKN